MCQILAATAVLCLGRISDIRSRFFITVTVTVGSESIVVPSQCQTSEGNPASSRILQVEAGSL
jgi:hypothetical protein